MSTDNLIGRVLHDSHRVIRLVGRGGMGDVYEAVHIRLKKRRFAIKVLHSRMADNTILYARFRQEAEIASELGHPNIVAVTDFYTTDDELPCMVMEYLEGEDLGSRLERDDRLAPADVLSIVEQVGSALQAVHDRGVVHRDIKPANIFLVDNPDAVQVKVLDFGISKIHDSTMALTSAETVLGTPHYMSPEQALGGSEGVDHRTDIFALATITYQALSGKLPFGGPSLPSVINNICNKQPVPITEQVEGLEPAVQDALSHAMAKDAKDRTAQVSDFVRELAAALEHAGPALAKLDQEEPGEATPGDLSQTAAWAAKPGSPGAPEGMASPGEPPGAEAAALAAEPKPYMTEVFGIDEVLAEDPDEDVLIPDDMTQTILDTDVAKYAALHAEQEGGVPTTTTMTEATGERPAPAAAVEHHKSKTPLFVAGAVIAAAVVAAALVFGGRDDAPRPGEAQAPAQKAATQTAAAPAPEADPAPAPTPAKQRPKVPPKGEAAGDPPGSVQPPKSPQPAPRVRVTLELKPSGAEVYLDGVRRRDNPLTLQASDRDHRLKVLARGYADHEQTLAAGEDRTIRISLRRAKARARPRSARKPRRRRTPAASRRIVPKPRLKVDWSTPYKKKGQPTKKKSGGSTSKGKPAPFTDF